MNIVNQSGMNTTMTPPGPTAAPTETTLTSTSARTGLPPSLAEIERAALAKLKTLITTRAAAEGTIATAWQTASDEAEKEVAKARKVIATSRTKALNEADANYEEATTAVIAKYEARQQAADKHRMAALQMSLAKFEAADHRARQAHKDRAWEIESLAEAGEKEISDTLTKQVRKSDAGGRRAEASWTPVDPVLMRAGVTREEIAFDEKLLPPATSTDPDGYMVKKLEELEGAADKIQHSFMPKLLTPGGTLGLFVLTGALCASTFAFLDPKTAGIATAAGLVVLGALFRVLAKVFARKQMRRLGSAFGVFHAEALRAVRQLKETAQTTAERSRQALKVQLANDKKRNDDYFMPMLVQIAKTKDNEYEAVETEHDDKSNQIQSDRTTETRATDAKHDATLKAINAKHDGEQQVAEDRFQLKYKTAAADRDRDWTAMATTWQSGVSEVYDAVQALVATGERAFPEWAKTLESEWQLPTRVPEGIRVGRFNVDMYALPEGEPIDNRLTPQTPVRAMVPAYMPFPDQASVLIKAADQGRTPAIHTLQAVMLRFLTGLPPGKVRFTMIDPVGRGDNFGAFMHLNDFDEKFTGARIWTEPRDIEQRLLDLTEHMENVIQKYLRNQYKSIEEYNQAAGEVAEPYRVLVIANFPANFTSDAAQRLVSIMSRGPSCGVCTLMTVDTKAPLPRDFRLADLEQVSFNLVQKDSAFVPTDATLATFPLTLDDPPDNATMAKIIRRVGEASRDAGRVEVPFDFIMPAPDKVWTSISAKGVDVPIGRAGATKRQYLALGKGTAQHTLIVGKTGSGKSTLLHALITNVALHYSPEELELYLIDFKEGVEFKMYAANRLPHARVIAIESEREFGFSVMQRLDGILSERGELFREAGANDIAKYREITGKKMSRILLIVDEFQKFFAEDDKLSNEVALLFDRLVRQGRAFGMHVILGSQTLGGSYSLPRSTIDQMAVRIALQCSEADGQLILSKDNNAARLLGRPGEAIYNDANGLVEGNNPFQVVWLTESRREELLGEMRAKAGDALPPPLVFEGNLPAVLAENKPLAAMRANPPKESRSITCWLGDAIAIKDPTAAVFRAQSGSNLLLIGQQEEDALAIITSCLVSILVQVPSPPSSPEKARIEGESASAASIPLITLLDGTPDDGEHADYLRNATRDLGIGDSYIERHQLPAAIQALHAEYDRRQKGETADRSPRFLVIQGLSRFRELRKAEDDFGFGRKGDGPKPPGDLFAALLRDGPAQGIHIICWCDTLTNFNRGLDRAALKEFTMRVLFQMSATDSSHLLDTPAANRLDRNRALFTLEDQPRPEKFRPYGLPERDWLKATVQ
jgi:ABC-type multidrug transport system fused ATPase/permease subunit